MSVRDFHWQVLASIVGGLVVALTARAGAPLVALATGITSFAFICTWALCAARRSRSEAQDLDSSEPAELARLRRRLIRLRKLHPPYSLTRHRALREVEDEIEHIKQLAAEAQEGGRAFSLREAVRGQASVEVGSIFRAWISAAINGVCLPGSVEVCGSVTLLTAGVVGRWGSGFAWIEGLLILASVVGFVGLHRQKVAPVVGSATLIAAELAVLLAYTRWTADDLAGILADTAWIGGLTMLVIAWRRHSRPVGLCAASVLSVGMLFDACSCALTVPGVAAFLGLSHSAVGWANVAPLPGLALLAFALPRAIARQSFGNPPSAATREAGAPTA